MIAGAALPIVGGAVGALAGKGDADEAARIRQQIVDLYGDIDPLVLDALVAEQMGPSAFEGVKEDPALRSAQMSALERLMQVGREGGMTAEDRLVQAQAEREAARYERGQREAIEQNAQARGMGGGGQSFAAQLQAQQSGAERAYMGGMDAAAQAQRRALDAVIRGGQLGGQIRGQDFDQAARKAQAADEIARFNAGQRTRAGEGNRDAQFQSFNANLGVADRKAGAMGRQADDKQMWSDRTRGAITGAFQGAGAAASAYGQGQQSQANFDQMISLEKQRRGY